MTGEPARYPSLRSRPVLVTGGADGIGAAMVEALARQGARVALLDIDARKACGLAERLASEGQGKYRSMLPLDRPSLLCFVAGGWLRGE